MTSPIYVDHAATTPVDPAVLDAMLPWLRDHYGNPSSAHSMGAEAREAVERARRLVAKCLNAAPDEIVFTSGGTEANNAAIRGAAQADPDRRHILCSTVEHHAVLEPMERLAHHGWAHEAIPVDGCGFVCPHDVADRLRPETLLVSVMHANNEVGAIQPIGEIGAACRARGVLFHTDAVQAFGKVPIDVRAMQIDMLSLSAHKLYGPKGVGALYVRAGTRLCRYQDGGEQERGRRGGTLNVPGIVGLGEAARLAHAGMQAECERLTRLRNMLAARLTAIDGVRLTGSLDRRMAGNVHVCVAGVDGSALLVDLDFDGICASGGSACSSGATGPSHVLTAMGVEPGLARGAVRITFGHSNGEADVERVAASFEKAVGTLRRLSRGAAAG